MDAVPLLIGTLGVLGLVFFLSGGHVLLRHRRPWFSFLHAFCPAAPISSTGNAGSRCGLNLNGVRFKEEGLMFHLSPQVQLADEGLIFYLDHAFFRAPPVLVRFDQVKSFCSVREGSNECLEVDFEAKAIQGWARISGDLAQSLKARGVQERPRKPDSSPADQSSDDLKLSPAATQYKRRFRCSAWTAEALETLDNRDPVDGFTDVEQLWACIYEHDYSGTWTRAHDVAAEPSTSSWLSAYLQEAMVSKRGVPIKAVTELLRIMRLRVDRTLGTSSPGAALESNSCPQCDS